MLLATVIHNILEGLAVGVSFGQEEFTSGSMLAVGIGLQFAEFFTLHCRRAQADCRDKSATPRRHETCQIPFLEEASSTESLIVDQMQAPQRRRGDLEKWMQQSRRDSENQNRKLERLQKKTTEL